MRSKAAIEAATASSAASGLSKILSPHSLRNSPTYAALATLAISAGVSALFISTGLKNGCLACSSSVSARPSQKRPPAGTRLPSFSILPKRGAVARYITVGASRVPNWSERLPCATPIIVLLLPVKARRGSWHEAHAVPAGSDRLLSKNRRRPSRSRGVREVSSMAAASERINCSGDCSGNSYCARGEGASRKKKMPAIKGITSEGIPSAGIASVSLASLARRSRAP